MIAVIFSVIGAILLFSSPFLKPKIISHDNINDRPNA